MNADTFLKSKIIIRWGSQIAFWPIYSASFALRMNCLPACNQNALKCDWSILLGQQMDYKQKPEHYWYQNLVPLPTDSAFICRYLFIVMKGSEKKTVI